MGQTSSESAHSVHPSIPYAQAILRKLPEKTGRSVYECTKLLDRDGPKGAKERLIWFKSEHGLAGTMVAEASVCQRRGMTDTVEALRAE